jgi:phosphoribosylglycinamide formyltransferase 2
LAHGQGVPVFGDVAAALQHPDTHLRLFGKPRVAGHRRVAVTLARGVSIDIAKTRACDAANALATTLISD